MGTLIIRLYLIVLTYYEGSDRVHEIRGICRCSGNSEVHQSTISYSFGCAGILIDDKQTRLLVFWCNQALESVGPRRVRLILEGGNKMAETRTLKERITAALDVDGVHPGDYRWEKAFNIFFEALKDGATIRDALHIALDMVGCHDLELRNRAFVVFDLSGAEAETAQGEIKPQGPARPRLIRTLLHRAIKWLTEKN